jgi:hypothetical protein
MDLAHTNIALSEDGLSQSGIILGKSMYKIAHSVPKPSDSISPFRLGLT